MSSRRLTITTAVATVLAGTSLYPLFSGSAWFWGGLGATITVAGVATLTRLRRLPVVVCLAATVLGLTLYLNLVFEAGHSLGHVLPTPRSLELLGRLARSGVSEAGRYAPPAPELPGIVLLGTGGIGIVALLTDLIAVRLRSVALAGIPLLLLITEPFAVSASRSWVGTVVAFCLGTAGYLGMLSAESTQRIREWEQPRPGLHDGPDTSALTAAGRRVGIASVVVALCLPALVPGLHVTRLVGGQPGIGGNGSGGGVGGAGLPSPEQVVAQQLQESKAEPVLTYKALDGGATVAQYLQLYVLDEVTDAGWQSASQDTVSLLGSQGVMPAAPGVAYEQGSKHVVKVGGQDRQVPLVPDAASVATAVTVSPGVSLAPPAVVRAAAVLPVPYPATQVVALGNDWQATRTDLTVYSPVPVGASYGYDVFSADLQPSVADLNAVAPPPDAITNAYLSLPASYEASGYLKGLAHQITAGETTEFGEAEALQSYLGDSGKFSYTLKAPTITDAAQLTTFLNQSKKGYCQQFAVAMADLARILGIPSRVVVGYTSGAEQRGGSWMVTTADAHEWPELYFSGYGWLRFEPTPTGSDGQGSATVPSYANEQTGGSQGKGGSTLPVLPTASSSGHPSTNVPAGIRRAGGGSVSQSTTSTGKQATRSSAWGIGGLVLAGLLVFGLIAPSAARMAIRRRRWGRAARGGDTELAHVAWRELQDDLVNFRAGYSPSETPRALGARVGARVRAGAGMNGQRGADEASVGLGVAALERITLAEEQARYAARPASGGRLRQDSAEFRRALAATRTRRTRWRARVLPLSVLAPTASGVSQAADAVGNIRLPRPRRRHGRAGGAPG
jgi:transglutaminase-like putative cysteine protease